LFFRKKNKKITIDSVNLNGYIDSDFDEDSNNSIEITKLNYKPNGESVENCINLSGNIKINESNFNGNSSCRNRLLHYSGFEKYTLDLKKSKFNGEYECPFLSVENALNANIETSYFEKGYSSRYIEGGAGMMATFSTININDCTFNDILSFNDGGAFNFKNNIQVEGSNLYFNNVTSLGLGSIFQISSYDPSKLNFSNIVQQNTGNMKNMREGGLIMNIEGQAEVEINSYHAENLINNRTSGSAFSLTDFAKLTVRDVNIKNLIGNGEEGGLFYTSIEPLNVEFYAYNVTLHDLYQSDKHETSIIYVDTNNYVSMDGIKVINSGGYNTNFINGIGRSYSEFKYLEVDNFESKTAREFVNYESDISYALNIPYVNNIKYCKISNVKSSGVLFRLKNGSENISNCEFRNIHECYKYNNCTSISSDKNYVQEAELFIGYGDSLNGIYFTNISIDKIYGVVGVILFNASINMENGNVSNSYFKRGLIYMNAKESYYGTCIFRNSKFVNNTSERGTIINLNYLNPGNIQYIQIFNSIFINNSASKFGGVIYSLGEYNFNHTLFSNCTFNNNHAESGNIIYAHSKYSLPSIGIIKSTDISTIPEYFKKDGDGDEEVKISILSGERIPEGLKYRLYDGYDNQMYFPKETSNIRYEDLVLFNVEVNDTYNAKVLGQTKDYCWDEFCEFPPVAVIGNPGIYILSLKFKSFGSYQNFVQDSIDIEIEILECDERIYINQAIDNFYLKSCYFPKCEFNCNDGNCINNDVCDCTNSTLKGKYCNEYMKLERYSFLDKSTIVIAYIILIILIVIIGMTISYRNTPVIKGGAIEFLILTLIGLIINIINTVFLTYEKTENICYQTYIFSNMGFSFVFGSIFVKSFRIYRIFCRERKSFDIG